LPDAGRLWMLADLATPWCLHVAVTLGIADHIAAGTTDIGSLAVASRSDPESLQRVLRHLVSKGVFDEPSPGRFALNDTARGLLEPAAKLGMDLDVIGGRMANAWNGLLETVRTGSAAYPAIFGKPFWDDLRDHPRIAESFDALMGPGHGAPDPNILPSGDWDSVRTMVDVGGGTGSMLAEVLRAHPAVRGTLVDLPATVARSTAVFRDAGVEVRVTTVGQSFFDPLPAGADLYLLKNVLADWPDREALALLQRCGEAARPAGRVVVLGGVSPDDAGVPSPALLMMVLVGGKDRTLSEFRALAHAAGLDVRATGRQASGRYVVECAPDRQR
jgi:2,7-dihydroxy-5-methyl-1-naphthoate 7-O-methyltransferase